MGARLYSICVLAVRADNELGIRRMVSAHADGDEAIACGEHMALIDLPEGYRVIQVMLEDVSDYARAWAAANPPPASPDRISPEGGETAVALAFTAYESGRNSVLPEPSRLRFHVAREVAADVVVHGRLTPVVLVAAEVLEEDGDASHAPRTDQAPAEVAAQVEGEGSEP